MVAVKICWYINRTFDVTNLPRMIYSVLSTIALVGKLFDNQVKQYAVILIKFHAIFGFTAEEFLKMKEIASFTMAS